MAHAPKVAVVEDEEALSVLLRYNLEAEGFEVDTILRGDEAEIRLKDADGRFDPQAREYMGSGLIADVDKVAARLKRAVQARRREVVLPGHAKLGVFLLRHFPGLTQALAARLSKKRLERRKAVQGR